MNHGTAIAAADATVTFSEAELLRQAKAETGLADWGGDDFLEGLRLLLQACANEAQLSERGQQWLQRDLRHWLTGRLHIQDALNQQPEILETPIERPLFIVGLPRTGSTFLHRLLGQDEYGRAPVTWELSRPAPPPRPETHATDPRIALVADEIARTILRLLPDIASKHEFDVQAPDECTSLFEKAFSAHVTGVFYHVPSYQAWIRQRDLTTAYQYYKRQVQLLCYHFPGRTWISKNPDHLLGLDAMLKVFPDASIIYLHRDLTEVFGSICSIQHSLLSMWRETPFTEAEMGEIVLNMMAPTVDRAMEARKRTDPSRYFDLQYSDLVVDPLGTVERIYDYFGYALSTTSQQQMNQWLAQNQQHKHGKHHYDLEKFGLTPEIVHTRLAEYAAAFQSA